MCYRCHNSSFPKYYDYGGRGITVCDRWRNSFDNFVEDMGDRPDGHTLDRINISGNYEPSNCRWANWHQQALGRRIRDRANIHKTPTGYRVQITIEPGKPCHTKRFKNIDDANDYLAICKYERNFLRLIPK